MADAVKDGPEAATGPIEDVKKNGTGKKKIITVSIIIAVQVTVVLLAGQFVVKPMVAGGNGTIGNEEAVEEISRGTILVLENIVVNLNAPEASRFLKVSVGVEVANEEVAAEVDERRPELRDIVISTLSGRPVEHVITLEGKDAIRSQLKEQFTASITKGELINIYFSEFVVQ